MKRKFLDTYVSDYSLSEVLNRLEKQLNDRIATRIVALNANKIYLMRNKNDLQKIINSSHLIIPEYAVIWGARRLGMQLKEHIGGIMLMKQLLKYGVKHKWRFYFLGSKQEVLNTLIEQLVQKYPDIQISGWNDGYFKDSNRVIERIQNSKSDVLFCAMGSPRQEYFLYQHEKELNTPIMIGVGGSFEVLAGYKKETPDWMRHGFEWIYRLIQDPRNLILRYLKTNPYFVYRVVKARLSDIKKS